jgi:hypothetical protein
MVCVSENFALENEQPRLRLVISIDQVSTKR